MTINEYIDTYKIKAGDRLYFIDVLNRLDYVIIVKFINKNSILTTKGEKIYNWYKKGYRFCAQDAIDFEVNDIVNIQCNLQDKIQSLRKLKDDLHNIGLNILAEK